jgi:uncharacterized protein
VVLAKRWRDDPSDRDPTDRLTPMTTTIGVAHVGLALEGSFSLKDKRREVRSLTNRIRNQFNVAVAEVADLDDFRIATIAVVCVSNSAPHADQMLEEVLKFIERHVQLGVVQEIETELIPI